MYKSIQQEKFLAYKVSAALDITTTRSTETNKVPLVFYLLFLIIATYNTTFEAPLANKQ